MTEKRFTVYKTIGMLHCFYVNDDLTDKVVIDQILHKYEADRLCKKLNELNDENKQLKTDLTRTKVALNSLQETYSKLLKIIPKE